MALSLFHPDYNTTPARLERYAALLDLLRSQDDAWYALPWEVADWWQRRRRSRLVADRGTWHVEGPAANDARIWSAHLDGRHVVLEVPGARAAAATTRARRAKS
jgi:hypothetical protein